MNSKYTILGKWPDYINYCKQRLTAGQDCNCLDIPKDTWLSWNRNQQWAENERFLVQCVNDGREFLIKVPSLMPDDVGRGSFLETELTFLSKMGFM